MSCIWTQLTPFNLLALVYRCYTRGCVVKELSDPSISASRSSFISKAYYTQEKYDLTWRNLVVATKFSYHSEGWISAFLGYVFLLRCGSISKAELIPNCLPHIFPTYLTYCSISVKIEMFPNRHALLTCSNSKS